MGLESTAPGIPGSGIVPQLDSQSLRSLCPISKPGAMAHPPSQPHCLSLSQPSHFLFIHKLGPISRKELLSDAHPILSEPMGREPRGTEFLGQRLQVSDSSLLWLRDPQSLWSSEALPPPHTLPLPASMTL